MKTDFDRANAAVIADAANWIVQMHDEAPVPDSERLAFIGWLKLSPVHVREFLQAEADWLALEGIDQARRIDVEALLRSDKENVFFLDARQDEPAPPVIHPARKRYVAGIAASLVAAAGISLYVLDPMTTDSYATTLGEQRTVVLADGSVAELNTQTRIRVHIDDQRRDIELLSGEALFSVEHDASRPFRVLSGSAVAVAIGTRFNVYRQQTQTVVTVVEGLVAVALRDERRSPDLPSDGRGSDISAKTLELTAGEQALISFNETSRRIPSNPGKAIAWRERQLVFEKDSLETVATEFNRYNSQQIVIDDQVLKTREISGVFNADRPKVFVRFLTRSEDVTLIETPGEEWRLRITATHQ